MRKVRYTALGPLLSGEGSRAFLGLEISEDNKARPVVLIWAPEATSADPDLTAKLARETARAAKLQHPNIIRVLGLAQVDEGLARVVEFADGESLRKVLDVTGTLPPEFAAFVVAEAAAGVHFAHLTGNADGTPLVHGDLRPETVMISFSGTAKVAGYGALSLAPKEMGGQRVKGRRAHCAPEQVLGGRDTATRETDVYLLGIILYECLTGMVPFGEEANFDQAVVSQPLRLINFDAIPIKLVDVIGRATAKRASDRFPTALAFREALEHAMGGLPEKEEFGEYLKNYFPPDDESRAARRREIDAGIADFARKQWEDGGDTGQMIDQAISDSAPRALAPALMGASAPSLGGTPASPSRVALAAFPPSPSRVSLAQAPVSPSRVSLAASPVSPSRVALGAAPVSPSRVALGAAPQSPSRVSLSAQAPSGSRTALPAMTPRTGATSGGIQPPPAAPVPAEPARKSRLVPIAVGALALIAIAAVAWGLSQSRPAAAPPVVATRPARATPAPAPTPAAEEPAPVEPAPTPPPPQRQIIVAPQPAPPPVDTRPVVRLPPKPPPPPPEPPGLDITTSPPLEVSVDGQVAGRAPLLVELTPGKHQLALTDAVKGIRLNKTVVVPEHGKLKQSFSVGKGKVAITAPPGSQVLLDGKSVGKAPLADFDCWEGAHKISVLLGKAKWQQAFSVRNGETMTFNVQTTPLGQ